MPLSYKNMPGSPNAERTHPGRVSAKTFTEDEIKEAYRLGQTFGSPETREWLLKTNFRKDPTFIEKILTWGRAELPRQLDDLGVKSLDENPEAATRIVREMQGGFEAAVTSAKSEWVKSNGPIHNYSHPSDEWTQAKEAMKEE